MTAVLSGTNGLLQAYDYQTPATGFSYTFAAGTQVLVMNPAGTLATGTITMPAAPVDGMTITISSTKIITALTLAGNGATLNNAVATLAAGQVVSYIYRLASTAWFPYASDSTSSIGFGQTWQAFTFGTNRISGTTYYNTTGKPIQVLINGSGVSGTFFVDGIKLGTWSGVAETAQSAIVPPGGSYVATATSILQWSELR